MYGYIIFENVEKMEFLPPELKEKYSDLLTIIVPRHPNRGQEVADEIKNLELSTALRSKGEKLNKPVVATCDVNNSAKQSKE